MSDQVSGLLRKKIPATVVNSALNADRTSGRIPPASALQQLRSSQPLELRNLTVEIRCAVVQVPVRSAKSGRVVAKLSGFVVPQFGLPLT